MISLTRKEKCTYSFGYVFIDNPERLTDIDVNFKKEFNEFLQSKECDPENCEHCVLNSVCSFTKPPEYIEKN